MSVIRSTYTDEQDRDGIYVTKGGTNTVYKGFQNIQEAREFANGLGDPWHVWLNGTAKDLTGLRILKGI